jgi:hypothetical protein
MMTQLQLKVSFRGTRIGVTPEPEEGCEPVTYPGSMTLTRNRYTEALITTDDGMYSGWWPMARLTMIDPEGN